MKKAFAAFAAAVMVLAVSGCSAADSGASEEYTLGMGVSTSIASSSAGNAQVDAAVAAVILDRDGKIVQCRIDAAQNKMSVADGEIPEDAYSMTFLTKKELGEDYGMKAASSIGREWYEQAEAFEDYVVGMTADDVAAIPVENGAAADETLYAGCTVSITPFIEAVSKACADDGANAFTGDAELALTAITSVDSSTSPAVDGDEGTAAMYTSFAAVAVAEDGRLAAVCYDEVQPEVTFDETGEITSDTDAAILTKRELGDDYGMKAASSIGREWYEQGQAFEDYVTGMTADDIAAIPVDGTDEELAAGCTVGVSGMIAAVVKAMALAV